MLHSYTVIFPSSAVRLLGFFLFFPFVIINGTAEHNTLAGRPLSVFMIISGGYVVR